jgi:hypothetical protein
LNVLCHITYVGKIRQITKMLESVDIANELIVLWNATTDPKIFKILIWIGDNVARDMSAGRDRLLDAGWLDSVMEVTFTVV